MLDPSIFLCRTQPFLSLRWQVLADTPGGGLFPENGDVQCIKACRLQRGVHAAQTVHVG